ncbi:MAG: M1 family metallopeptidase [Chitinispirillaceae bacterium]|nr:M1 family metallopeptidase [Chitinispirillaceae bacterium]
MPDRLPQTVLPKNYNLTFDVDFEQFTFIGKAEILVEIQQITPFLRLHCEELDIADITIRRENEPFQISFELSEGELHVKPVLPLEPGNYFLRADFSGKLNDDLCGFYRSRYIDTNGQVAYLATTQFEAPYARKAFPCFDEPAFKASFRVSLTIPEHMTGISNMPVESETLNNGRKSINFVPTPPMSTYLLYMGAGNFDFIEQIRDGRSIRVYGVNGKSKQGTFALQFAADALEFFEHYTDVPYPLPKLDLLAIPDFAAGAMENWGAITFREVLLYVDESTTSLMIRKNIAEVIAHELWHQWSGNLVTMKWWDDLWLNEAFATYQAFKAVDRYFSQWHILDDFIDGETKAAFTMDMLSTTHPIAVPVHTANEIEEIFDDISYGKGGSVLRMIEEYIGVEAFRKGVTAYLKKFSYKNAIAEDLWETLEQYSGSPIKEILISWITKPGFPLLNVTRKESSIHLTQQLFSSKNTVSPSPWPIPLTWISQNGSDELLFNTNECTIAVNGTFIKFNKAQSGFYRTRYDKQMYTELLTPIKSRQLHEYDRWGILNDLWACVFAGYAALSELLELMDCYDTEDHLFVLRELFSQCREISQHLRLTDQGQSLFNRYRTPFAKALDILGWQPVDHEQPCDKQLRPIAIEFLIRSGDEEVQQKAFDKALDYLDNGSLEPDLRTSCLSAVSAIGTRELFNKVKKAYEEKSTTEEKLSLLGVLCEFTDPSLLTDYLDYSLTDNVRRQDLRTVFSRTARNPSTPELFFDWVRQNWEKLQELRKSHFVYMGLLQALINTAPDENSLDSVRDFLLKNSSGYVKTRANAFERAQLSIAFRNRCNI